MVGRYNGLIDERENMAKAEGFYYEKTLLKAFYAIKDGVRYDRIEGQ